LDLNNKENKNCKNYKKFFNEYLNNGGLYVTININDVKFNKDSIDDPLKETKIATYNLMSKNIIKRDTVYLTKTELKEDNGIILSSENIKTKYGFSRNKQEFYFFEKINSDDEITSVNNSYYSLAIISDTKYKYYSRKYMKFQDVLALLASFMNLLISITRGIYAFYYRFRLRNYFFRKLVRIPYDNAQEEGKNKINILNQNSNIELKAASDLSERNLKLGDFPRDSNGKSFVGNVLNEQSRGDEFVKDSGNRFYKEISKNESNMVHNKDKINDNNPSIDSNKIEKVYDSFKKVKETNTFSFWENLKINLFKRNTNNKKYYLKSEEFSKQFLRKFDIFNYLKKMRNLSLMKKLLLGENELNLLNLVSNKYFTLDSQINKSEETNSNSKETFEKNVKYLVEQKDKSQISKVLWEELGLN